MGSAHILVLGFLGAHNPYTPTLRPLIKLIGAMFRISLLALSSQPPVCFRDVPFSFDSFIFLRIIFLRGIRAIRYVIR